MPHHWRRGHIDRDPGIPQLGELEIDHNRMWQTAVDYADEVIQRLRKDPTFDQQLLLAVMRDLCSGGFSIEDIIAVYNDRRGRA